MNRKKEKHEFTHSSNFGAFSDTVIQPIEKLTISNYGTMKSGYRVFLKNFKNMNPT